MNDTPTPPSREPFDNDDAESDSIQTDLDAAVALLTDTLGELPSPTVRPRTVASLAPRQRAVASPHDALADTVASFGALLTDVSPDQWDRPALGTLSVRGLVGHTIGVDQYVLGLLDGEQPSALDHRAATQPAIDRAGELSVDDLIDWYSSISTTMLNQVATAPGELLALPVPYFALHGPLGAVLVARAFELWNHTDDIRRALGLALAAPSAPTLSAMTDLATALVPGTVPNPPAASAMRLVLTGAGGGTWVRGFDAADSPREIVTVIADAVEFCRWIGDRIERAHFGVEVIGDTRVGESILAGARSLALD